MNISKVVADKGYDSKQAHTDARGILGPDIETVIPARNKEPKSARQASRNVPKGWFRR